MASTILPNLVCTTIYIVTSPFPLSELKSISFPYQYGLALWYSLSYRCHIKWLPNVNFKRLYSSHSSLLGIWRSSSKLARTREITGKKAQPTVWSPRHESEVILDLAESLNEHSHKRNTAIWGTLTEISKLSTWAQLKLSTYRIMSK